MLNVKEQDESHIMTLQEQSNSLLISIERELGTIVAKLEMFEKDLKILSLRVDNIQASLDQNNKEHYVLEWVGGWFKPLITTAICGLGYLLWKMIKN